MLRKTILSGLATLSLAAGAQNLSTEITVDRTIVPEEHAATPLASVRPAFVKPITTPFVLNPTEYTFVTDYKPLAGIFDAPAYSGVPVPSDFRGYVRAAYFPAYNLGFDLGYRVLTGPTDRLGVAASFTGSSYNSHDVDENRTVSDNTFGVQADYAHTFASGGVLGVQADYFHSALKSPALNAQEQKQGIDAFKISANFGRSLEKFTYDFGAYFDHFGMREPVHGLPGANSNIVGFKAKGSGKMGDYAGYSLAVGGDMLSGDGRWWRNALNAYDGKKKIGNLTVNPALFYSTESVKVRVGAVLNYSRDFRNGSFHAAPDVHVAFMPTGQVTVFAQLDGGEQLASLRSFYNYSPYAVGSQVYGLSFTKIDGRAGFTVGPFGGLSVQLYGRYTAATDVPMLTPDTNTYFKLFNLTGWSAGAKIAYRYGKLLSFDADAQVLPNSLHHGLASVLDRASFILSADLRVRPIEKLTVGAGFEHRGGRRYFSFWDGASGLLPTDMGSVDNLTLSGDYCLTEAFAVGLSLENLLCKRPLILPGISAQGLHGLLSATYRF